ncbi:hypothetical protein SAMN02745221_01156 [Thermosyntropha lipolytica DSM 11003]|uniref:Uncharacterized protein n=1 Tax=Thermosyntropha lipolytica DSM 11003 TaxID=1123382 RepID=A0A1M5NCJ3_9FIRM|nr:hypothetical protein [Thermosyntropha lipolytica]SHG87175.1 hypothetical protein SAMN02745221_01156 [Thermosyntropha lipolytica DSM 11003]
MSHLPAFVLEFLRTEKHLLLPNITAIITAQTLYDILFQYCITPEKEEKLKYFIDKLETHIKSKSHTPFSMPYQDLEFLEEGLQELRLLNWMEADIALFQIKSYNANNLSSEEIENIIYFLNQFITCKRAAHDTIYVYPDYLTRF